MVNHKGGKQARIGLKFFDEVEDIKNKILEKDVTKERVSTEKITNCIIRHSFFKKIKEDIINLNEEGLNTYGE